ncbi:MAG TPA: SOS response-associated peptidase family protein, partial [Vicinamibacteria bacterium]
MCGRFTLTASGDEVAEAFGLDEPPELEPRYNIAPSQDVAVVMAAADRRRRLDTLRWGL